MSAFSPRAADNPLVSVVIPCFNGERFLGEAIDSVLAQSYAPIELIIVDDASGDCSLELAYSYEGTIVIARAENGGVAVARNEGLARASGEYFGLLDQDDLMVADRLERQVGFLLTHPEVDAVLGTEEVFVESDGDPNTGPALNRHRNGQGEFDVEAYYPPSVLIKTSDLRRTGGFDTTVDFADDLDLILRLREDPTIEIEFRDEIAVRRRFHASNQIRDAKRARRAVAMAFKRRIERTRAKR